MNTKELINRCVDRDHSAWALFVKRYESLIIRSVRYKLNKFNKNIAKNEFRDIVQEIFLSLWETNGLSKVRDAACLEKWLVMVSINKTLNYCRKRVFKESKRTLSFEKALFPETPAITLGSVISSDKFNSERMIESKEIQEIVERELDKLSYRQQLALKLSIYNRLKQKDIADIMYIPENTVATLIKRAKNQVREGMAKYFERK